MRAMNCDAYAAQSKFQRSFALTRPRHCISPSRERSLAGTSLWRLSCRRPGGKYPWKAICNITAWIYVGARCCGRRIVLRMRRNPNSREPKATHGPGWVSRVKRAVPEGPCAYDMQSSEAAFRRSREQGSETP